uniref:hypothetical protein n=1 Tax=Agathobacter sp. TaxID=2021311 RepID=UPI004056E156
MSMSKQELFQAFREAASMEFAEIPRDNSQIKFVFSKDFENRMNSLIKQMSKESKKSLRDSSELEAY